MQVAVINVQAFPRGVRIFGLQGTLNSLHTHSLSEATSKPISTHISNLSTCCDTGENQQRRRSDGDSCDCPSARAEVVAEAAGKPPLQQLLDRGAQVQPCLTDRRLTAMPLCSPSPLFVYMIGGRLPDHDRIEISCQMPAQEPNAPLLPLEDVLPASMRKERVPPPDVGLATIGQPQCAAGAANCAES